jgi:hypothetical protein
MAAKTGKSTAEQKDATEVFVYHSSDELAALSDEELQDAWDTVPNDGRKYVEKRYAELVRKRGVLHDASELQLTMNHIERYKVEGYVPIGNLEDKVPWARVKPKTIRNIVESLNEDPIQSEQKSDEVKKSDPPYMMIAGFVIVAFFAIFIVSRLIFSSSSELEDITVTATVTLTPTSTATATPLPTNTPLPTLTPFAFTNVDRFVGDGDRVNNDFFPVALTIGDGNIVSRVFIVQEREVETAEWQYETNTDVATWLSASSIRPVFAIPYSESNEEFLASLSQGFSFQVRLNTGAELIFDYLGTNYVGRNDTSFFLQDSPGIVLALVGKTDDTGLPTSDVLIVSGSYRISSELDQLALLQSALGTVGDTLIAGPAAISVTGYEIESEFLGQGTISDYVLVLIDVMVEAHSGLVSLDSLQFSLIDQRGSRTVPAWSEAHPLPLDDIVQGDIQSLRIPFLLSRQMGDSEIRVQYLDSQVAFFISLTPPPVSLVTGLDVQIMRVEHDTRNIYVSARIFNGQAGAVYLSPSDVTVILGYVPQPIGVERSPEMWSGITIQSGEAWDIDFQFTWNGRDPYGMFMIAGRSYAMTIIEPN